MARELFVYWKIGEDQAEAAASAVGRFQLDLQQAHPQLQVRRFRRVDVKDGIVTLMETYGHPGGIGAALQASIEAGARTQLIDWCKGPRHTEVFDALGS